MMAINSCARFVAVLPSTAAKFRLFAVTAFGRSQDRTQAMLAGYQAHIAKPIEPQELVVTIGSQTGEIEDVQQ